MADLIDAILDGIKVRSFFYSQYYGAIEYRPLTLKEVEECYTKSFRGHSMEAVNLITSHRLGDKMEPLKAVELAVEVNGMRSDINSWIVYHAVKDFQPPRWRQEKDGLPLGMHAMREDACVLEIDSFAASVLDLSTCPRGKMESFLSTRDGKVVGMATWKLDMPIIENLGDVTELQLQFLSTSLDKYTGEWKAEKSDSVAEAMKKIKFKPNVKYDEKQLDIIKQLDNVKNERRAKK
jgi:hypothetical protein